MENNESVKNLTGLGVSARYSLRKTGEEVEVISFYNPEDGARSEQDWVSYIDSEGGEHIREHLNIQFDFKSAGGLADMFEKLMKPLEPVKMPEFDPWEQRRYDLAKQFFVDLKIPLKRAISAADGFIAALKEPKNGLE